MKIVFLDANVLFSAAHRPAWTIGRLIVTAEADFITSRYAILEARRNLDPESRPQLDQMLRRMRIVPDAFGAPPPGVVLRGKDIPILASAAAAGADLLVTGDERDFGSLFGRTLGGVKIIPPCDLARELR